MGHMSVETLLKPIERMRQFQEIRWHLIPGNQDAHVPNGPWERLIRTRLPDNIYVHTTSEPKPLADDSAWVLRRFSPSGMLLKIQRRTWMEL